MQLEQKSLYDVFMPVHCGARLYETGCVKLLGDLGVIDGVHIVLDLPRGYALWGYRPGSKYLSPTIVVTDCPSPLYIEDITRKKPQSVLFDPDEDDLRRALLAVLEGKSVVEVPSHLYSCCANLTPRERQVLEYIVRGYSNKAISELLQVQPQTVHNWVYRLLDKMNLQHRTQIPLYYYGYLSSLAVYLAA